MASGKRHTPLQTPRDERLETNETQQCNRKDCACASVCVHQRLQVSTPDSCVPQDSVLLDIDGLLCLLSTKTGLMMIWSGVRLRQDRQDETLWCWRVRGAGCRVHTGASTPRMQHRETVGGHRSFTVQIPKLTVE